MEPTKNDTKEFKPITIDTEGYARFLTNECKTELEKIKNVDGVDKKIAVLEEALKASERLVIRGEEFGL